MPSLRELRRKIKSVKTTQQITRAMKMVAAARMRKAQERILQARPFAFKMQELLNDLAGRLSAQEEFGETLENLTHPLLEPRTGTEKIVLLLTSDKGLCGSFNTNLLRKTLEYLRAHEGRTVHLFVVGRKGRDFLKRHGVPLAQEYLGIMSNLTYAHAELIGKDVIDLYLSRPEIGAVDVIYNEFKSVLQQKLQVERLLPVARPKEKIKELSIDFIYEPSRGQVLESLLPRFVKAQIQRVLLESYASEMGGRMTAMDSATKNAGELIQALTLVNNKARQSMITREILEVVSGAEALG